MKNQIVKFGVLAALLGIATVQGAKIKQGPGFLSEPNTLAQTGAGCEVEEQLSFGGENDSLGQFHRGVFQSNSAEAIVGVANVEDMYHDHRCYEAHQEKHCDQSEDCSAGQGCGVRKKTTIYEGEVVYRDQKQIVEQGSANEWNSGCEQIVTNITQVYGSMDAPEACVQASVCPQ